MHISGPVETGVISCRVYSAADYMVAAEHGCLPSATARNAQQHGNCC